MSFDLAQAVAEAPEGGVVAIPPGTYPANLLLDKPVSLLARGVVVLDGLRRGSVLRVRTQGVVRLAGLTIVGGRTNTFGGGVSVEQGEVELLQCTLRFNEAPAYGGGAFAIRAGHARISQCRFEGNTGRQGGGLLVDETGRLTMRDSLVAQNAGFDGGGLRVKEAGEAELLGCTLADNKVVGEAPTGGAVSLSGSTTRTPSVTLSHCIVSERSPGPEVLHVFAGAPGTLVLRRCLLPEWCAAAFGGGDSRFAAAGFVGSGPEPYLLSARSPAAGAGEPNAYGPTAKDVLGCARDRVDLGAFAFTR